MPVAMPRPGAPGMCRGVRSSRRGTSDLWAWTPNFPSVPTSRATFFTSAANIASWSIMSLMVFTRFNISPETDTPVIFCVKSPRATAVYKKNY